MLTRFVDNDGRQCNAFQYQGTDGVRPVRGKPLLLDTNALSNIGYPIDTTSSLDDISHVLPPSWSSNQSDFVVVTAADSYVSRTMSCLLTNFIDRYRLRQLRQIAVNLINKYRLPYFPLNFEIFTFQDLQQIAMRSLRPITLMCSFSTWIWMQLDSFNSTFRVIRLSTTTFRLNQQSPWLSTRYSSYPNVSSHSTRQTYNE